jgi:hypothetical protein
MVRLLIEKAYDGWKNSRRIGNIEVVAYEEGSTVHIDITGDAVSDLDEISSDFRYAEAYQKLSSMKCQVNLDNMNEEGTRISVTFQR